MPAKAKGARLYRHRSGVFYIRDTGIEERTTGRRNRHEAEKELASYIAQKDQPIKGASTPDRVTIAEVLDLYGREHATTVKDPVRIGYAIAALLPFFGTLPVSAITGEVCRRYAKIRDRAPGTIRKELGTMQAAINHCHAEGYITASVKVKMPPKPTPRDRWLSRNEVARLLRAARRNPTQSTCADSSLWQCIQEPARMHFCACALRRIYRADMLIPKSEYCTDEVSEKPRPKNASHRSDSASAFSAFAKMGAYRQPTRYLGRRYANRKHQISMEHSAHRVRDPPCNSPRFAENLYNLEHAIGCR